jgi:hypothetical protein
VEIALSKRCNCRYKRIRLSKAFVEIAKIAPHFILGALFLAVTCACR